MTTTIGWNRPFLKEDFSKKFTQNRHYFFFIRSIPKEKSIREIFFQQCRSLFVSHTQRTKYC